MQKAKKILIVDDNLINRKVLGAMLQKDGYDVVQAENGKVALDILTGKQQQINLVLLDISMPVMDGHQFLAKLNELDLISKIPVIVLTGSVGTESEITCLQEGASDFLIKPYNKELVRHRVESILRLWDNALLVSKLEKDLLTGVYNAESFFHRAQKAIEDDPDHVWTMIYVTIEDFKLLRDRYGSEVGDRVLAYAAQVVKNFAGRGGLCGRLGNEEFVTLQRDLQMISQKELGDIYAQCFKDAPVSNISVKSGLYEITDDSLSIADICERAKLAEQSIQHQYGVYYAIYKDTMASNAFREHQLTSFMEEALEKRQFVVYLQPKHSTVTGEVAGAEALIRWIHPELGFISPGEFIPLFERNGFIAKVDYFVWREACRILRTWLDAGIKPVPISVNASRVDFFAADLPSLVINLVEEFDLPPELLHVEITESAYTENPQQLIPSVSLLRDMGFKIEMDDFGSGYSSLNMLSELPIDILKLDMKFMQQGTDRLKGSKRNILSFIVSLSKWLQLPTVAEGVETQEEFNLLKAMGCNLIQGYFFSKPIPIDTFAQYMKDYKNIVTQEKQVVEFTASAVQKLPGEKRSILVVEDIESNREVMKMLLNNEYNVATAENGLLGYEYIKAHSKEISCILLDLLMPVMDGFTLLEKLHEDGTLAKIPVIITTETGSDGELRALTLGANSFVAKPYNADVLRHHIRKAIEEKELLEDNAAYKTKLKEAGLLS